MREAPGVATTVVVIPVVVQGVEDFLDRGATSIDNPTFTFLTLNTAATEETEFPLRKLPTYSNTQIRCRLFVVDEVAAIAILV